MGRVVVFLFDETPWRVEAAGAYEMKLERFAEIGVSLERAPDAAWALGDDRVIEVSPPAVHAVPAEFAELIGEHALVYVPITAGGRWLGLIVGEPHAGTLYRKLDVRNRLEAVKRGQRLGLIH